MILREISGHLFDNTFLKLKDSLIVQCAKYWHYWNLLAEKKAEWRFRIEDLSEVLPELIKHAGLVLNDEELKKALKEAPSNYNYWNDTSNKITWNDLQMKLPKDLYKKFEIWL